MSYRVRKRRNRNKHEIYLWTLTLFVAVAVAAFILIFVGERTNVNGESMQSTLFDGDQVIMDKFTYRLRNPKRYEIVVFPGPNGKDYVKRVIGLPGESVRIQDGKVYVNDRELREDYLDAPYTINGELTETITLRQDEYFVMGDNRFNSEDSRFYAVGPVNRDKMIGRVVFRLFPWNRIGTVNKD